MTAVLIALAFLFVSDGGAQVSPSCSAYFHVARLERGAIHWDALAPEMARWWAKDRKRHATHLCYTRDPDLAEYVVVWQEEVTPLVRPASGGAVPRHVSGASLDAVNLYGSRQSLGDLHFTATSLGVVEVSQPARWTETLVTATVYRRTSRSGLLAIHPIVSAATAGRWPWSQPRKDAIIQAVEAVKGVR